MTAEGFADAVERYRIRTIINVRTNSPIPTSDRCFWNNRTIKESELCQELGVRYIYLAPTADAHGVSCPATAAAGHR